MTDASKLARRFLALWEDYLSALLSDPCEVEQLQRWVEACFDLAGDPKPRDLAANEQAEQPRPPVGATSASRAPGERDDVVAELSRRLANLEERLVAIERRERAVARPRGRSRGARV